MAKKRTEVKAQLVSEGSFFERHRGVLNYTVRVLIGGLFLFGIWKVSTLNSVQKDETYNYVCQVVGADPDLGMMAMKCMAK